MSMGFLSGVMKNVLELDCGDDCTRAIFDNTKYHRTVYS